VKTLPVQVALAHLYGRTNHSLTVIVRCIVTVQPGTNCPGLNNG
jgi:hypothetical protein